MGAFARRHPGRGPRAALLRDIDGREVDFVVTEGRAPVLMVECKWGDAPPGAGLRYLKARFARCEAWQVSAAGAKDYETPEGLRVASALALLRRLAQGRPCPAARGRPEWAEPR